MILTRFIAFILVCTRMLNLIQATWMVHLAGISLPPQDLRGHAMEKPTEVGCRAVEPTSALGIGQRGIGGWGKAFLLPLATPKLCNSNG